MSNSDQNAYSLYCSAMSAVERHAQAYFEETVVSLTASVVQEDGLAIDPEEVDDLIYETVAGCEAVIYTYRAGAIVAANPDFEHDIGLDGSVEARAFEILLDAVREEIYDLRADLEDDGEE